MKSVGVRHTKPEKAVRSLLHRLGYRFRLHSNVLPGKPDIVLAKRKAVIFVHGCYWHGHGCRWGQLPKSRLDYWASKISANKKRDARRIRELKRLGWMPLVVWQCELKDPVKLEKRLTKFLDVR